jgi:plastocyanin
VIDVRLRRLLGPAAIVAAGLAFLVSGPAAEAKKAKPPTVTVGSNFYVAPFKSVAAGTKVRFQWESGGFDFHDVRVKKGPVKFRSPLQAGGSFTTKKLKAGSYTLFCSQHPEEMQLNLKVKKR